MPSHSGRGTTAAHLKHQHDDEFQPSVSGTWVALQVFWGAFLGCEACAPEKLPVLVVAVWSRSDVLSWSKVGSEN